MFFFNDTATTEIYTLSLHDALPICPLRGEAASVGPAIAASVGLQSESCHRVPGRLLAGGRTAKTAVARSEEHTSELQSRQYTVCRLLLAKKTNICLCFRKTQ